MSILYEERLDGALPDVDRTSVLMALREHVPGLEILHTDEEIIPYECDGLSAYRTRPLLVVLPKQMEQVTAILAVCHRLRVPVVTRGAGTGLSGGALPLEKGVLLVMARFKEILDINPVGRRARVQPGVRNLAISQAVAPHNLYYAPDPSSQIACSIGGNVAENAGGVHCLKYGLTVHNLLKIEVQTLDGEALTLGSDALDSPGFDLHAATARVLDRLGISVMPANEAGCCGAVDYHLNAQEKGLARARNNIDAWWPAIEAGAEAILQTASGCGAFVKEYGQMLKNDALYADKARQVSELAVDLVELLREEPLEKLAIRGDKKLAFHCPCTLQHAQKLNGEVEKVLLRLGFTLTDVPDSHLCCGSAGTYALTHPDLARQLRDNKMNALESGKPEMIVTANIGCQTHLASAGRTSVRHWIEIVEQALEKE